MKFPWGELALHCAAELWLIVLSLLLQSRSVFLLSPVSFAGSDYSFNTKNSSQIRAVDPLSFFADPDPAVFLNADPCGSGSSLTNLVKNKLMKSFL